ncbi:aminotransferase class IV [Thalassospira profundimaris]|uniref:aminotransferase class IV n=1 Tax=Thalassospira profundimaris TaxID=502049 RepID=UPI000DEDD700|nr:aminotransferase class IV [Thalassospira profundimaris]
MLWFNGQFLSQKNALIPVQDRGFLLGDGIFETMCATHGKVPWLSRHLKRISQSFDKLGNFSVFLPDESEVATIVATLCREIPTSHAVIRLTVSRGQGGQGLLPRGVADAAIVITAKPFDPAAGRGAVSLAVSHQVRRNPWSVASRVKSLNYLDNIIARQEADSKGAEDSLILTQDGCVGETTIANVFALFGDVLQTASSETGIFSGLARAEIIDWAQRNHISICYDPLSVAELYRSESVFICNALRGVREVREIDGRHVMPSEHGIKIYNRISQHLEQSIWGAS